MGVSIQLRGGKEVMLSRELRPFQSLLRTHVRGGETGACISQAQAGPSTF